MKFKFCKNRIAIFRWQKAQSFMSEGAFGDATKVFERLEMPNGPKQIVLLQYANALYHLGEHEKALEKYLLAKKAELKWGARKNKANSEYIIAYADLYSKIQEQILQSNRDNTFDWTAPKIKELSMISASKRMKDLYLPLPTM